MLESALAMTVDKGGYLYLIIIIFHYSELARNKLSDNVPHLQRVIKSLYYKEKNLKKEVNIATCTHLLLI